MSLIKKNLLSWTFVFLFFIGIASAASYTFEKDTAVDLKIACIDDTNRACDDEVACNITIFSPNSTAIVDNKEMTWNSKYYNYTLSPGDTSTNGIYSVNVDCTEGGQAFSTFTYEINNKGVVFPQDTSPLSIIILVPLILSIIFLIGAATLDQERHGTMKIGLFLLSIVPFFVSSYFGTLVVIEYYGFATLQDAISSNVFWFGSAFFVIMSYFIIYSIKVMIDHAAEKKQEGLKY